MISFHVHLHYLDSYVRMLGVITDHCRPHLQTLDRYWSKNIGKDPSIDTWSGCVEFIMEDKRINSKSYENMEPGTCYVTYVAVIVCSINYATNAQLYPQFHM